jgi:hypothetical protein
MTNSPYRIKAGLIIEDPVPTDYRYGPYESVPEALLAIPVAYRYVGLTCGVFSGGNIVEYWFQGGVQDGSFVIKTVEQTQGLQGVQGIQGIIGETGIQGLAGETALQGIQGIQGPSGSGGGGGSGITIAALSTTFTNSISPATIPTVNPSQLVFDTNLDEGVYTMTIGFPFQLFGQTYTSINFYSNNFFTFGPAAAVNYGWASYEEWVTDFPYPGVYIGSDDGSMRQIYATQAYGDDAPGAPGSREATFKYLGTQYYNDPTPNIIYELTLKENQPNKLFLKILAFTDNGDTAGVDFFTFSTTGRIGVPDMYTEFDANTQTELEITLSQNISAVDYTASKLTFVDSINSVTDNTSLDLLELDLGYVKSDPNSVPTSGRIYNIVSMTQADYDSLTEKDPQTLYIIT